MKAMILCAGLGTRLRPLTEEWPKPAMPLLGAPIFRYALAALRKAGVDAVGINTHHLGDRMRQVAQAECNRAGASLTVAHEDVIQGTAGGIRGLRRFLEDDVFVLWNGDILFDLDVRPLVDEHRRSGAISTLVLMPMPRGEKYSAVETDAGMSVRRLAGFGPGGEKLTGWHFTGVHILSPEIFDFMSPTGAEDSVRDVYPRALAQGRTIRGAVVNAFWSDVGTPARYLACQRDLLHGLVEAQTFGDVLPFDFARGDEGSEFRVWTAPGATVHGKITGPAFLDEGATIHSGARVGGGVYVGKNAVVPDGARLNRCAVLDGTRLREGEELVESIAYGELRIAAPLG